jgi:VWFA-related protein
MSQETTGRALSRAGFALVGLSLGVLLADSPVSIEVRTGPAHREAAPASDIRVDSSLVQIPVSVTDTWNHPITGLDKSSFRVFDSNVEQQIVHMTLDDTPLAVGLVFDTSASMKRKLPKARAALAEFLETANPEDEFFLVEFNDTANLVHSFTAEPEDIRTQLASRAAHGRTALLDAIGLAMREVKKSDRPRKAILIISDGGDNRSRYTESEVRNLVRESDVLIYAMGIFESGFGMTEEEIAGPALLQDITEQSGGRIFPVRNLNDLPDVAAKIGLELHNRYVLAYVPSNLERDGKYHKVQVKLVRQPGTPRMRVAWREGYYAPGK